MSCSCFPIKKRKRICHSPENIEWPAYPDNNQNNCNNNFHLSNPLNRNLPVKYDSNSLDSFGSRKEKVNKIMPKPSRKQNSPDKKNMIDFYRGEEFSNWKKSIDSKLLQTESMRAYLVNCFKSYDHLPEDLERLCKLYTPVGNFDNSRLLQLSIENGNKEFLNNQLEICETQSTRINNIIDNFNDVIAKAQQYIIQFARIDEKMFLVTKTIQRAIIPKTVITITSSDEAKRSEDETLQSNSNSEMKANSEKQTKIIKRNYRPPFNAKTYNNSFKSFQIKKHSMEWILKPVGMNTTITERSIMRSALNSKEKPPWVFN